MNPPPTEPSSSGPRTFVLGVLGGIASGKSAVAKALAGAEGRILDADRLAHEALNSAEMREWLLESFGSEIVGEEGQVDRTALGARVFGDPDARKRLEDWIHPVVRARIGTGLEEARSQGVRRVILDVPLLLENDAQHGLTALCDFLVFVDSEPDVRDARAVARRGWKAGEVARREALQLPLHQKRARADFVVDNRKSLDEIATSVAHILKKIGAD